MQMVIASRLTDGRVVFLAEDARWVEAIDDGIVAGTLEAVAELLDVAERSVRASEVVDPYAIEVRQDGRALRPKTMREAVRAFGPTIAFTKQDQRS